MSAVWDAVGPRAIGMATHLLGRAQLEALAAADSIEALAVELERHGISPATGAKGLAARLDLALRRETGRHLENLLRWCGARPEALAVFVLDEDRRSVRRLLRGAVGEVSPDERLSGLVPTRRLPESKLQVLAHAADAPALAAQLIRLDHPYGTALAQAGTSSPVDLTRLEVAIDRAWAGHSLAAARRAAPALLPFIRQAIDIENVWAVLLLCGGERTERQVREFLIEPTGSLDLDLLRRLVADQDVGTALHKLEQFPDVRWWVAQLSLAAQDPVSWERLALGARLSALIREKRLRPLGATPVLWYWMRLRAQLLNLSRLIWGITLGVPESALRQGLVTA